MNSLSFLDLIVKFERYLCPRIPDPLKSGMTNENQIYIVFGIFISLYIINIFS